jgi:Ca2+-binding EF-hand superfamily protein
MHRLVVVAGLSALVVSAWTLSAYAQGPAQGSKGKGWKKGQGWELFSTAFDADKDGKVTKDELMAKQPAFDRADANHDGMVTEGEYDAMPAAKKHPNLKGWIARYDADKDQKVSLAEWNEQRVKAFEAADKNKDGAVDKSEFTPALLDKGPEK